MTAAWSTIHLAACVELTAGLAFKSSQFTDDPDDVALVKGENIGQGRILWDISKRWPAVDWDRLERFQLWPGDVVLAMDRPWVPAGLKWAFIRGGDPKALLVQRVARLRSRSNLLAQAYLRYVVGSPAFEAYVQPITTGVNVPHVSGSQILDYETVLPPVRLQNKIVEVLSAYDDLIENNLRRVRILEEMARRLYREWFVEFRFPGGEAANLSTSPLGSIPAGWEVREIRDVAEVNRAQINARAAPDEVHYIDIASVSPGQVDTISTLPFADAPGRARRIVQHGDVLWSTVRPNRRAHALIMHPAPDTIASTGFAVLSASKVPFVYLYEVTTTDDFVTFLTNNATGSAYPAVTGKTFAEAKLLVPPTELLERFASAALPMAQQAHTLRRQIANLRLTRDLLLPRLTSGQIRLGEAAA